MAELRAHTNPDHLQTLFERALREGVQLRLRPDGTVVARSTRDGATRYAVGDDGCTCPAGAHGKPCKHWALYLARRAFRVASQPLPAPAAARRSA